MRHRTILITGAGSGLGAALALQYAAHGQRLGLVGRRVDALQHTAAACRAKGADVATGSFDICDRTAWPGFLSELVGSGTLDLAICNAGIFSGRPDGAIVQPLDQALELIETNLKGTIISLDQVIERMRQQRSGRIAIISSLAAFHPLADAPAYSASKAGVAAYGEALREALAPEVGVSVVFPGHIDTAQTDSHVGRLPAITTPERAAARIVSALERGRDVVVFPRRLHWLGLAGWVLPRRIRWRANRPLRFHIRD